MDLLLKNLIDNWNEINQTTLELINSVPSEYYYIKPFKSRFKSFAWEFSCIFSTRIGYIRGLSEKILNEKCFQEDDKKLEKLSKEEMIQRIKETNIKFIEIIKNEKIKTIDYWNEKNTKESVISWLMQHEQLHYGKLILYFSKLNLKIPKSLQEMWGKESFIRK
jgi:uncharacterized damage-inducible protein DinB